MKILLTGGTGYIGSAVLDRLTSAGHEVTAVVRSDDSRAKVEQSGATGVVGDLFDSAWLREQLATHDAAIHTAAGSDADDQALNTSVVDAAIAAFGGTDNPFVLTGGVWTYGSGDDLTEDRDPNPIPLTAWRVPPVALPSPALPPWCSPRRSGRSRPTAFRPAGRSATS